MSFRNLVATRGVLGQANGRVIGAKRAIYEEEAFVGSGQKVSFTSFGALVRSITVLPFLRRLFVSIQRIGFQMFNGFLARVHCVCLSSRGLPRE